MAKINYGTLDKNRLVVVIAKSDELQDITLNFMKYFINQKKASCVYVTVAKPYKTMVDIFNANNISTEDMIFIDCITALALGNDMQRAGNCIFTKPESLTNLSIALLNALKNLSKDNERILIMDTLSTLMLYNQAKSISQFMHLLAFNLRDMGVRSVIFTLEEDTDRTTISEMTQFCDLVIKN